MYIACPKCDWRPQGMERWVCDCGHRWHTFSTHGVCPACGKAHKTTQCPGCKAHSDHEDWYHDDDMPTVDEYIANPEVIGVPVPESMTLP